MLSSTDLQDHNAARQPGAEHRMLLDGVIQQQQCATLIMLGRVFDEIPAASHAWRVRLPETYKDAN